MDQKGQGHIIDKLRVEVRAGRREAAMQLQEQLGFYLHSHGFAGELESLLDRLVPADTYLEIPTLQITVQCGKDARFGPLLLRQLEEAIRERMSTRAPGEILLKGQALVEAVAESFLLYGIQPYAAAPETLAVFVRRLRLLPGQADPELEALVLRLGRRDPMVWKRVFFLLGAAEMRLLVLRWFGLAEEELLLLLQSVTGGGVVFNSLLPVDAVGWMLLMPAVIEAVEKRGGETAAVQKPVAGVRGVAGPSGSPAADRRLPGRTDEKHQRQLQQGIPIGNAGLSLLWRDCGRLFKILGWEFTDDTARQRAIWLFDYIVWGAMGPDAGGSSGPLGDALAEERLPLNKILCGRALEEPVDPACFPDADALRAADRLLEDWLKIWKKDRTLSVAWFRSAFLQRPGVLSRRMDESWLLTVEPRTEDVLIDRPSVVRYPWMPRLLFVEW